MKQDVRETAEKAIVAVGGATATWSLQDANVVLSLFVGLATFVFVVVQIFFLLRKWYMLEATGWRLGHTAPADLDEAKD
jgi:hypothetical protein